MNQEVIEFKKNLIIQAAEKYFKEFGYVGTPVDKIAKDLGFGVGTIYSFFGSKEGLFYSWLYSMMEKAFNEIKEQVAIENNPLKQCEIFVKYKFLYYEKNKSVFTDFLRGRFGLKNSLNNDNPMKKVYQLLSVSIESLFKNIKLKADFSVDCYHLAYVLDGLVDSYIECYAQENNEINLVTKTKDVMRLFLNAIGMKDYEY